MGWQAAVRYLAFGSVSALLCASAFFAAPGFLSPAWAQTETRPFVTSYAPGYFAGSHPSSALEMIGLLPGFQLIEGDANVRGYSGAVGNVVIDGRPPTSKQETLATILQRITPDSVERIEIARSGAAGFNFQGYPLLANVVLRANNAPRGQVAAEIAFYRHGKQNPAGTMRMSWGTTHVLELSAAASHKTPETGSGFGKRDFFDAAGKITRRERYFIDKRDNIWNLTGGYRQPLAGGTIFLTGLYNEARSFAPVLAAQYFPTVTLAPGTDTEFKNESEAGIRYTAKLWSASELEIALLRRAETDHKFQNAFIGTEEYVSSTHAHSSESISHNVFRVQGSALSFEGGLDATLNTLNNDVALSKDKVNIVLPAASVRIAELRGEAFGTLTWAADPSLTIEPGLRYEMSQMKQQGDSVLTKKFGYLKPRLKVGWKLNGTNVVRLLAEREAGQLDFQNFVTSVEVKLNSVNGGNKDLIPQTLWRVQLDWEHAFPGGSVVMTARHEMISDAVDHIALKGVGGEFDGVGNVGNARNDEFQTSLVWPVSWQRLAGLTVQANALYRFSQVTDPNTHVKRSLSPNLPWEAKIALTQDLPAWKARLGASYTWSKGNTVWRYNELAQGRAKAPETEIFAEYKPTPEWLGRLFIRNLLDTKNMQYRKVYFGNRGSTGVNFIQDRRANYGPSIGLYVQRAFGP